MKTDQHNLSNEILRTYSYRVQSSCGAGQLYQNNSEICKTVQTDSVCFLFFFLNRGMANVNGAYIPLAIYKKHI